MTAKSNVLIIGAGAGGFVTGYYLSKAGNEVTFFVRERRVAELQPPQYLFSYDEAIVQTYSEYKLVCDMLAVAEQNYDFVLVTLDSHTSFSDEGSALLEQLGRAVAGKETVIVNLGAGVGITEHFIEKTGLPASRILSGTFNFLSHFVDIPEIEEIAHSPVQLEDLKKARVAYRNMAGKGGLVIENRNKQVAKRFAGLFDNKTNFTCTMVKPVFVNLMFNIMFPFFAIGELSGWQPLSQLVKDKTLWPLACGSVGEIALQPRFGFMGKLVGKIMGVRLWRKMWLKMDESALPLDFNTFNKVHHGKKVVAQDTEIMRQNLALGNAEGLAMPHLQELLRQLDTTRGKPC